MLYKRVLSIAGSDSGGGAGIQADIKAISACGCFATTAITAVTVQNTIGVESVFSIPADIIEKQIRAVMDDIGTDAVKIGMLHSSDVIYRVKNTLDVYNIKNIVVDPVMVSTSGHKLMQDEAIITLKNVLLKHARIITPNIPEAELLLGEKITSHQDMITKIKSLSFDRKVSVWLKAGHLTDNELVDVIYNAETDEVFELPIKRIDTVNTHGTGCTLSSALASFLALGFDLNEAVINAKNYIHQAITEGANYQIGKGHGPVHHFFKYWS